MLQKAFAGKQAVARPTASRAQRGHAVAFASARATPLASKGLQLQRASFNSSLERTPRGLSLAARAGKKTPPPPPEKIEEEEFEEDDLEEVELVALAFDITVDELPRGVKTGADLCKVVEEIIRKAAPGIPSEKDLEELGVAEEALLVVASTDDDSDPFSAEDDSVFAEILFLDENDATIALDKVVQALEIRGFKAELAEYDDDELFEEEDEDEEEEEEKPPPPPPPPKKKK